MTIFNPFAPVWQCEFTKFLEEEFFSREEMRVYGVFLASIPGCPHGVQVKTLLPEWVCYDPLLLFSN
jgi:hypothetical protein